MIYGIGTDVIAISRVEKALQRHGERFVLRILGAHELSEYRAQPHPARFVAKRFAAKEAFSKAMGTGIRKPVTWRYIQVGHDARGKPEIWAHEELQRVMQARGIGASHISITDERDFAVAFVVLERS